MRERGLSVRIKLTLSYAGFLTVAGIALFAVGFLLLRFVPDGNVQQAGGGFAPNRGNLLEVFVRYAWWTLGLLVVIGLVGGWVLSGLVLRPLVRITAAVRDAEPGDDRRVALPGRGDELTDLADAFDAMLDRVRHTIEEERRFAANASHELRTPHAIIRTMVEVARADPAGCDVDVLLTRLADTNDRAIETVESLLLLARAGRGDIAKDAVDLADVVEDALVDVAADGIRLETALVPVPVRANRALLARLASNLVRNAVAYNEPGGRVWIATTADQGGGAVLTVANTGPMVDAAVAQTLTEPFVRGAGRVRGATGSGLGLAIVAAVVRAHGGTLELRPRDEGGLDIRVTLPSGR